MFVKRDFGDFEFQRLASGVFYVGDELKLNDIQYRPGEIFVLYDSTNITDRTIFDKLIIPYMAEEFRPRGKSHKNLSKKSIPYRCKNVFGRLKSLSLENELISMKNLVLFTHNKKADLKLLSNDAGFLFKLRSKNTDSCNGDDCYTELPFTKRGHSRNVSD